VQYYGLNRFAVLINEHPRVVKELIARGEINHIKNRCDRIEIGADAALDYLAKKHPHLIASKAEMEQRGLKQIVKEETTKEIVKEGREGDGYIYDN